MQWGAMVTGFPMGSAVVIGRGGGGGLAVIGPRARIWKGTSGAGGESGDSGGAAAGDLGLRRVDGRVFGECGTRPRPPRPESNPCWGTVIVVE